MSEEIISKLESYAVTELSEHPSFSESVQVICSEAKAEIKRLTAKVERLEKENRNLRDDGIMATTDGMIVINRHQGDRIEELEELLAAVLTDESFLVIGHMDYDEWEARRKAVLPELNEED